MLTDANSSTVYSGIVKSFEESNGYGFIANEELHARFGKDVFLHKNEVLRSFPARVSAGGDHVPNMLAVGDHVTFEISVKNGSPQAQQVRKSDPWSSWNNPSQCSSTVYRGVVKSFEEKNGFGFIANDELHERFGKDVFLMQNQFVESLLAVGDEVTFEIYVKNGNPQARHVRKFNDCSNAVQRERQHGFCPNIEWRAVSMEELRLHPFFRELPLPEEVLCETIQDLGKFRQSSWQWDALHNGRLTTRGCAACLGFYEPHGAARIGVPTSLRGHAKAVSAWQQLLEEPIRLSALQSKKMQDPMRKTKKVTPGPWLAASENHARNQVPFLRHYHTSPQRRTSQSNFSGPLGSVRMVWGSTHEATSLLTVLNVITHRCKTAARDKAQLPVVRESEPTPSVGSRWHRHHINPDGCEIHEGGREPAEAGRRWRRNGTEQDMRECCSVRNSEIDVCTSGQDKFNGSGDAKEQIPVVMLETGLCALEANTTTAERAALWFGSGERRNTSDLSGMPLLGASPDAALQYADGYVEVVEVKNHAPFRTRERSGYPSNSNRTAFEVNDGGPAESIAPWHVPQLQFEMLCMGKECTSSVFCSLSATRGASLFQLKRDDRYISDMLKLIRQFHSRFVLTRHQPPSDFWRIEPPSDLDYDNFLKCTLELAKGAKLLYRVHHDDVQRRPPEPFFHD